MTLHSKPARAAALALLCALAPLAANAACDPNGADHGVRRCMGGNCGNTIEICNWATSIEQAVAPGTVCFDGGLVFPSDPRCAGPPVVTPDVFECTAAGWFCKEQCGTTLAACSHPGAIAVEQPVAPGTVCDNGALAFASDCEPATTTTTPTVLPPTPSDPLVMAIYADAVAPAVDATNGGWRFINTNAGDKINWYFFSAATAPSIVDKTVGNFDGLWVKFVRNSPATSQTPWINLYTEPTGTDDGASWYHTRVNHVNLPANRGLMAQGATAIMYIGTAPDTAQWSTLDGTEQLINAVNSDVDNYNPNTRSSLADSEIVKFIAFSTNSGAPAGTVDFTLLSAGFSFGGERTEFDTRQP